MNSPMLKKLAAVLVAFWLGLSITAVLASSYGQVTVSSVTPGTGATNEGKAEDAASAGGDTLIPVAGIRKDVVDTTTTNTDGDYAQVNVDKRGCLLTVPEPTAKATYAYSTGSFTLAASATDFFTITGSGTKTVKIHKIYATPRDTGTTLSVNTFSVIKRSTADSGGSSTTVTACPLDSNNSAATATVKYYTANPASLGTAVATASTRMATQIYNANPAATAGDLQRITLFDSDKFGQPVTLRGTSEQLVLNLGGSTQGGTSPTMTIDAVITEE